MHFIHRFKQNWINASRRRKTAIAIFLSTIIFGVSLLSWYFFVPSYVPLFTGLDPEQAHSVTELLNSINVPYKLAAAGTTITVPESQVHDVRIRLAGEGLFNSGIGFELFDGVKLGLTDFERRLNLQRALQEELRRTIVQFNEVEQARVHLVIPEQNLFQKNAAPPTASVAIKLKPLKTFSQEQVKSLVYLVSMSVSGLTPENVTIIDTSGRILSEGLNNEKNYGIGLTAGQLELKRQFEDEMESRLKSMLEKVFGPGQAVVMISANLNFDHNTVTKITYDAENTVLRSEHVIRERSTLGSGGGGVPGSGSNVPVYPDEDEEGERYYERDEHTRNWEIGSSETTVVTAPGRVEHLSASVTVSANLTPAQREEIEAMVAGALGISISRGDSLSVSGITFNTDYIDQARSDFALIERREMMEQYLSYGLKGLALLLSFILVLVVGTNLLRSPQIPSPVLQPAGAAGLSQVAAAKMPGDLDVIRNLIATKPGEVAEVMRAWAYED